MMKKEMNLKKKNFTEGALEFLTVIREEPSDLKDFLKRGSLEEIFKKHEKMIEKIQKTVSQTPLTQKRDELFEKIISNKAQYEKLLAEISKNLLTSEQIQWDSISGKEDIQLFLKYILLKSLDLLASIKAMKMDDYDSFWDEKCRVKLDDYLFFLQIKLLHEAVQSQEIMGKNKQQLLKWHFKFYLERAERHLTEKNMAESLEEQTQNNQQLEKKYKSMEKKFQGQKNELQVIYQSYEEQKSLYKELQKSHEDLKVSRVEKSLYEHALSELEKAHESIKKLERESQVDFVLKNHLHTYGLTADLMAILKPFLPHEKDESGLENLEDSEERDREIIGFCKIQKGKHICYDAEKNAYEITKMPHDLYLSNHQMLKIKANGQLIKAYEQKIVRQKCLDGVAIFREDGEDVFLEREGEILKDAIDEVGCFIASNYLESAVLRNQSVYAVLDLLETGFVALDVSTQNKVFISDQLPEKVKAYHVIFQYQGQIVKHMEHMRFLTKSETYTEKIYGTFAREDHESFVKCTASGEYRRLNQIPSYAKLEEGDPIIVDAYMNFINMDFAAYKGLDDLEKKELIRKKDEPTAKQEKESLKTIDFNPEKILIIGNKKYSYAYTMSMASSGFKANVVDGCEKWNHLSKAVHDHDLVIYITDHTSHTHTNRYKKDFPEKETLWLATEGANRVVEAFVDYYQSRKSC